MSGQSKAILAGVIVLGLGLLGAWRWASLGDEHVVPACSDLAEALPEAVPGSWTLTRTEPRRTASRSVARCEFRFRSADQAYEGTIVVDLSADDDAAALRRKATDGPCYGDAVPHPSGTGYEVARACAERVNDKVFAGVYVASAERYAHTLAELSSSSLSPEQVVAYANSTAQRIIDRAMALEATD